jgi:DNA-binding GntR family transcriptional regulator
MAAQLTSGNITPEQSQVLFDLVEQENRGFDKNNLDEYYEANDTLHLKIAEFSDNRVLYSYIHDLLDRTRIFLILYDPFYKIEYYPTKEHETIVNAIVNHDTERIGVAVLAHINSAISGLETAGQLPEDYLSI